MGFYSIFDDSFREVKKRRETGRLGDGETWRVGRSGDWSDWGANSEKLLLVLHF